MNKDVINKREMGIRLKKLREDFGYSHRVEATQDMIADVANIHRTGYNAVENGRGGMSKEALSKIVMFYRSKGVPASLDWIILGIDSNTEMRTTGKLESEIEMLREELEMCKNTLRAQNTLINRAAS